MSLPSRLDSLVYKLQTNARRSDGVRIESSFEDYATTLDRLGLTGKNIPLSCRWGASYWHESGLVNLKLFNAGSAKRPLPAGLSLSVRPCLDWSAFCLSVSLSPPPFSCPSVPCHFSCFHHVRVICPMFLLPSLRPPSLFTTNSHTQCRLQTNSHPLHLWACSCT